MADKWFTGIWVESAADELKTPSQLAAIEAISGVTPGSSSAVFTETVWTDNSNGYYVRVDTGGVITWFTMTGAASAGPGAGAKPFGGGGSSSSANVGLTGVAVPGSAGALGYQNAGGLLTIPSSAAPLPVASSAVASAFVDGSDVTVGAKADSAATNGTSAWSSIALLKWMGISLASMVTSLAGNLGFNLTQVAGAAVSHSNAIPIYDAYTTVIPAVWTSATPVNTTTSISTAGMDGVLVSFVGAGLTGGGHVTFEAYDGAAWLPIRGFPLESYLSFTGYTLNGALNNGLEFDLASCPQFRVRLDTVPTAGTVTVTLNASSAPIVPGVTVGLDPAQPLPAGSNVIGFAGSLNVGPVLPAGGGQSVLSSALAAGSSIFASVLSFPFFRTTTRPSGTIDQFALNVAGSNALTTALTVFLFSKVPASTINASTGVVTWNAADFANLILPPFLLTLAGLSTGPALSSAGATLSISAQNADAALTTNVYAIVIANAAVTLGASLTGYPSMNGVQD